MKGRLEDQGILSDVVHQPRRKTPLWRVTGAAMERGLVRVEWGCHDFELFVLYILYILNIIYILFSEALVELSGAAMILNSMRG